MTSRNVAPPPILQDARVLSYATIDKSVKYTSKGLLYVDGELLGAVPRLAICEGLRDSEIMLLYCNEKWEPQGIAAEFTSIQEAKQRAESEYQGVAAKWKEVKISKVAAMKLLEKSYEGMICSFCGKWPDQVEQITAGENAAICNECITEFYQDLPKK